MTGRVRLGNPGSQAFAVRLTVLNVLYVAEGNELRRLDIRERGWPMVRFGDDYGCITGRSSEDQTNLAERVAWMKLDSQISPALCALGKKGLVEGRTPDGWAAKLWKITAAGKVWRDEDVALLKASVAADLAALPLAVRP